MEAVLQVLARQQGCSATTTASPSLPLEPAIEESGRTHARKPLRVPLDSGDRSSVPRDQPIITAGPLSSTGSDAAPKEVWTPLDQPIDRMRPGCTTTSPNVATTTIYSLHRDMPILDLTLRPFADAFHGSACCQLPGQASTSIHERGRSTSARRSASCRASQSS